MRMEQKLEPSHRDILKKIAQIGARNASKLLSNLVGKEVTTTVSMFDMISAEDTSDIILALKRLVIVQYASIDGEIEGTSLLVFPRESALSLIDLLQTRKTGTTEWLSQIDQYILNQLSCDLVICYLNAIEEYLNTKLHPKDLKVFSTYGETINDLIETVLKKKAKRVFYLHAKLDIRQAIKGDFFLLLDQSLNSFLLKKPTKILTRLKTINNEKLDSLRLGVHAKATKTETIQS